MVDNYLSIDIGGTNIKYGLLDHSGNLMTKDVIKTPEASLDEFSEVIHRIIKPRYRQIKGIAFSVPGKVDVTSGTVYYGGSLPYLDGLSLKETFSRRYHVPVAVENDGKAAALAEQWLGSLKDVANGAVIVLGTGVGGGIVVNGRLLRGVNGQAGELSFMNLASQVQKVDDLVGISGSAVHMIRSCGERLGLADVSDGMKVFEAINSGDPRVKQIFAAYCQTIATVILNIQTVLDLQRIVLSGGISAQPIVLSTVKDAFAQLQETIPMLGQQLQPPEIVLARFQSNANLYGALYNLLMQQDVQNEEGRR